jgi:hypothetical protein
VPEHLKPFVKPEKLREFSVDIWIDKNNGEDNQSQYHCDREVEYEPGAFQRLRRARDEDVKKEEKK